MPQEFRPECSRCGAQSDLTQLRVRGDLTTLCISRTACDRTIEQRQADEMLARRDAGQ